MNREFIYFDNKIIVNDEKGNHKNTMNYYDNVNEVLFLENELDRNKESLKLLLNQRDKANNIISSYKGRLVLNTSVLGLGAVIVPFVALSGNFEPMFLIPYFALEGGIVALYAYMRKAMKNNYNDALRDYKYANEKIEEYTKVIDEVNDKKVSLENDKTISDNKYNNFDVVDVDTNIIIKRKILKK